MNSTQLLDIFNGYAVTSKSEINSLEFATYLDSIDELKDLRNDFHIPKNKAIPSIDLNLVDGEADSLYFSGNSLGLCPKETQNVMNEQLTKWKESGSHGHVHGKYPWADLGDECNDLMAELVGAKPIEVTLMSTLTVNLHLMMVSFYSPTPTRHKIIIEHHAFISDHVAMESQIRFHGFDPKDSLILVKTRPNETYLRTEDIIDVINKEGDTTALVMFSGVQYYTGQKFDMNAITHAAQKKGCKVGFDLAHAVGNVELKLNEWNVDFACWCTYKYLNSGPGGTAGIFLHERYADDKTLKRFDGWWGVNMKERFTMDNTNIPMRRGAKAYEISNIPVFSTLPLFVSLEMFHRVGFKTILKKQKLITGYLEYLIQDTFSNNQVSILTPRELEWRGCQLSLSFSIPIDNVYIELKKRGITCDIRRPYVIRVAPAPLYNSYTDVYQLVSHIKNALSAETKDISYVERC